MAAPKNIIWDLGGTLLRPNPLLLKPEERDIFSFLLYMWGGKEATPFDLLVFSILSAMGEQTGPKNEIMRLHNGDPIPLVIVSFLAGKISSEESARQVIAFFNTWRATQNRSSEELRLIEQNLITFFAPLSLVKCVEPIPQAARLLECSSRDNNKHFILSNWDRESFSHVYERFKHSLFSYFSDGAIVISGDTGLVKPEKEFYTYFLNKEHLDPNACLFIDDQQENIDAAEALSIESVRFIAHDIEPLNKALGCSKSKCAL